MNPEHDRLVARIQHFYDLLLRHYDEARESAVMNEKDKTEYFLVKVSAYDSLVKEYEAIFGGMIYTEKL